MPPKRRTSILKLRQPDVQEFRTQEEEEDNEKKFKRRVSFSRDKTVQHYDKTDQQMIHSPQKEPINEISGSTEGSKMSITTPLGNTTYDLFGANFGALPSAMMPETADTKFSTMATPKSANNKFDATAALFNMDMGADQSLDQPEMLQNFLSNPSTTLQHEKTINMFLQVPHQTPHLGLHELTRENFPPAVPISSSNHLDRTARMALDMDISSLNQNDPASNVSTPQRSSRGVVYHAEKTIDLLRMGLFDKSRMPDPKSNSSDMDISTAVDATEKMFSNLQRPYTTSNECEETMQLFSKNKNVPNNMSVFMDVSETFTLEQTISMIPEQNEQEVVEKQPVILQQTQNELVEQSIAPVSPCPSAKEISMDLDESTSTLKSRLRETPKAVPYKKSRKLTDVEKDDGVSEIDRTLEKSNFEPSLSNFKQNTTFDIPKPFDGCAKVTGEEEQIFSWLRDVSMHQKTEKILENHPLTPEAATVEKTFTEVSLNLREVSNEINLNVSSAVSRIITTSGKKGSLTLSERINQSLSELRNRTANMTSSSLSISEQSAGKIEDESVLSNCNWSRFSDVDEAAYFHSEERSKWTDDMKVKLQSELEKLLKRNEDKLADCIATNVIDESSLQAIRVLNGRRANVDVSEAIDQGIQRAKIAVLNLRKQVAKDGLRKLKAENERLAQNLERLEEKKALKMEKNRLGAEIRNMEGFLAQFGGVEPDELEKRLAKETECSRLHEEVERITQKAEIGFEFDRRMELLLKESITRKQKMMERMNQYRAATVRVKGAATAICFDDQAKNELTFEKSLQNV